MRSTKDQDEALRQRLREAVERFADNNVDKFGRSIGYTNGGYIRETLGGKKKPVRQSLIDRVHEHLQAGWFEPVLSTFSKADLLATTAAAGAPWPLPRVPYHVWKSLPHDDRAIAEDAYVTKLQQLAQERAVAEARSGKQSRAA